MGKTKTNSHSLKQEINRGYVLPMEELLIITGLLMQEEKLQW